MSEKECELLSTRGLIEEKELQRSQEVDKATKEIRELQGRLLEKVQCCVESLLPLYLLGQDVFWGVLSSRGGSAEPSLMQLVGYDLQQQ